MAMTPEGTYETSDMELAAFLCVNGAPFPETERHPNGRSYFIFADPDGELAWQGEQYRLADGSLLTVNPKNLFKAYGLLKRTLGPKEPRR